MPEADDARPSSGADRPGLSSGLRSVAASALEHARLRFQILELEGKEAGVHYLKLLVFAAAGLVFLLFAYLFLLIGLVFLLSQLTGWPWAAVTAGTGALHLLLAGGSLLVARSGLRTQVFRTSLQEFKRDTEWLREKKKDQ